MQPNQLRLGINIDHVATLRNARGGVHPCPVRAAQWAMEAGADGITAHLREDRRHIRDADMFRLKEGVALPLNMEMAATDEMVAIALKVQPNACCLVPEKREELTTEGGLDVAGNVARLRDVTARLQDAGIRVSLFVDANERQLDASQQCGADIVELHTGRYCDAVDEAQRQAELAAIQQAATQAVELGIECHAGHGLCFDTVQPIAAIAQMCELNIGHFLMGEAMFVGLKEAIVRMRVLMDEARS